MFFWVLGGKTGAQHILKARDLWPILTLTNSLALVICFLFQYCFQSRGKSGCANPIGAP
ncbi:hypothetical protein BDZ91DRAFT_723333 [Kalaharituber pfeilii]|nr:hypothetical protein BDZ91DRAFT_723333 [Kalaharituber pfeilii]